MKRPHGYDDHEVSVSLRDWTRSLAREVADPDERWSRSRRNHAWVWEDRPETLSDHLLDALLVTHVSCHRYGRHSVAEAFGVSPADVTRATA